MELWLVVIAIGVLTYLIRLSFIVLFGRMRVPGLVQRGLRFVPVAVLTAIIVPELVFPEGHLDLSLQNPRLLAGVLAALVAWRTRNTLLAIGLGMVALWSLQGLLR
jgi:branched-subunit amino acid transport protein